VELLIMANVTWAEDLMVLATGLEEGPPKAMMNRYLTRLADAAFERRAAEYEKLKTPEQLAAYQERMREFFLRSLGGFPEKTPLNPQTVGRIDRDDYRIEKVIFESQPRHYVTGNLYLPRGEGPFPAVLVPCGHSANGKAEEKYQRVCLLLAKNGLAAFCYDPIGQGERYQLLDDQGRPKYGSTLEHTLVGVGSILLGTNTARYRIYDGMRALDYLESRADIDPQRIGCTGNSGGGTLTSYLMALDPRIACAAPSCFLTSLPRLIHTIGPQDAEQNLHGQIAFGLDHADYVLMRAPKPTLICTATGDFFDIHGAWDTFREAKRFYTRLGFPERVDLVEADETHGFSQPLRTAVVRWMRRWLLHADEAITEPDFPVLADEELQCTPQGQVMLLEGARSVFEINADLESSLARQREKFWAETPPAEALQAVRDLVGIRRWEDLPEGSHEKVGVVERDGYRIDKIALRPEEGIQLPALLFVPPQPQGDAYLYVPGAGKAVDAGVGGPIEALVLKGHLVLAVDLRGIGETEGEEGNRDWRDLFGPGWKDYFLAYLLGRSYLGMRTEDILVCARFLRNYCPGAEPLRIHLMALGEAGPPALHAAALEPDLFASLTLKRSLVSWSNVVRTPEAKNQLVNAVPGALSTYDLPDLLASLPPEKVTVEEPVDAAGKPVDTGTGRGGASE